MVKQKPHRHRLHKRFRIRRRKASRVGATPGAFVVDKSAPDAVISVTKYCQGKYERIQNVPVSEVPSTEDGTVIWIDVVGLGNRSVIRKIGQMFNIHDLAIEDVVNTYHRPKLEVFDQHLYLIARMPTRNGTLDLEQVSMFIAPDYVLTWQEKPGDCFSAIHERLENGRRQIRKLGPDYLAYALLDAIVDSYFPIVNQYSDSLDEIEDQLELEMNDDRVVHDIHHLRSEVRALRRTSWAMRDLIRSLMSYEGELVTDETRLHLRDVADHTIQLVELLEVTRDSCSDLRDLYMAAVSMRMNEVMKVLTIIATIFIPLGFIAGLYGMNFATDISPYNMPETQWYFGYPIALLLMALVAGGMVFYFRRKGWLGQPAVPRPPESIAAVSHE